MYNPLVDKYPYGATALGIKNTMTFTLTAQTGIKSMFVILRKGERIERYEFGEKKLIDNNIVFKASFIIDEVGIWYYRFEGINMDGTIAYFGSDDRGNAIRGEWLPEWQLTVAKKLVKPPLWAQKGVVYHIFADRFFGVDREKKWKESGKDGSFHKNWEDRVDIEMEGMEYQANDYFGGNAKGIIEKIPYLQSLGVTQVYISPVFESHSNHRYDTADYSKIDNLFGTETEFKEMVSKLKNAGINTILDGVFNHTGSDSVYFNKKGRYNTIGAYQSRHSKYYDWYNFIQYPDVYECWWGCTVVPTVNKAAKGWNDLILGEKGILNKWQKCGVKGWRLDVVDELPTFFVKSVYENIKKTDIDSLVIGEVWEDASTKVSYGTWRPYCMGEELDGTMNYPFRRAIIDYTLGGEPKEFESRVYTICNNYPKEMLNSCYNNIGTHDTIRILTALSGVEAPESKEERLYYRLPDYLLDLAKRRLMFASTLQFTLPGIPCIFYGDEAGIQGFEDPLNRSTYPWGKEDEDLIKHYKKLGVFRKKFEKYLNGETSFTFAENNIIEFIRRSNIGELLVIANSSNNPITRPISGTWKSTDSGKCVGEFIEIAPLSVEILYRETDKLETPTFE